MAKKKERAQKKDYGFWLNRWLEAKKPIIKESTYIRYRNTIENHIRPELGRYSVCEINASLMEKFVNKKLECGRLDKKGGLSPKSISDILIVIKETLKYAQAHGESMICSFDGISLRKRNREMRVLSVLEERRLLAVLLQNLDRYKLGVCICLYTGIRIGELCALQWKHISIAEKTIKIERTLQRLQRDHSDCLQRTRIIITEPKSFAAARTIPLPDFLIKIVEPFAGEPDAYVLSEREGAAVEPRTMQNRFKSYLEMGQIADANFHSLRHTFATRCIEAGFDMKSLSEILGHSSVKITLDKYVHSSMQLKRSNMDKLKMGIG